jgi:hydroxymethyl cephem carbamoyltransferase
VLIVAFHPGHDGAVTAIRDGTLVLSLEAEKNSFERYSPLTPEVLVQVAERLDEMPDVLALGGWETDTMRQLQSVHDLARAARAGKWLDAPTTSPAVEPRAVGTLGVGYVGPWASERYATKFFGKRVEYFTSSHERSHILGALGMAPREDAPIQAVLVWEGMFGAFYLVDRAYQVVRTIPVMAGPGVRYGWLFALCDPSYPLSGDVIRLSDSGKLMALAAYGNPHDPAPHVAYVVDELLGMDELYPFPKGSFRESPLFNCGVQSELAVAAAAVLTRRMFDAFADVAVREIPAGIPLRISGGCGLNCEWNAAWRNLGHFSSVFVPPCPNDSGAAIGTAIDAQLSITGSPHIDWNVYAGQEFEIDAEPNTARWQREPLEHDRLAETIARGAVVAWVQGRWEIGPRALGNRSLLAEPFRVATRRRLNEIKAREDYRPIAPCARVEDLAEAFVEDFEDPHMLYFRRVRDTRLAAVTHVDGSARVQTVSAVTNPPQHALLTAFGRITGLGVLCNTSLNLSGRGFINRMSHLAKYCEERGIDDMVVGSDWYKRRAGSRP